MPKTLTLSLTGLICPEGSNIGFFGEVVFPITNLASVQSRIEAAGAFDDIMLDIDSDGGIIEEGWRMYDYFKSLGKPINTRSGGMVCSMATTLMMLGTERLLSPHAKFMVHQPGGGVEGNISYVEEYLTLLKTEQDRLISVYSEGTGKDESEIAAILADGKDHYYTADEAMAFGWTTGIYHGATQPAKASRLKRQPIMAHLSDWPKVLNSFEQNNPPIDMTKLGARLLAALGVAQAVASGTPLKAILVDTADGKKLDIETTGETYVVGDSVKYEDGSDVPDGDYVLSDDNTITVGAGVITDITEPEAAEQEPVTPEPTAQVADETVTISKAEFDRLSALDTQVTALVQESAENKKFMARVTAVLALKEGPDPVVAKLPETPIERRNPVLDISASSAIERKKERLASRNT